jgi:hypothetical protein
MYRKLFASSFTLKSSEIETLSEPAVRRQPRRFITNPALINRVDAASPFTCSIAECRFRLVLNNVPVPALISFLN